MILLASYADPIKKREDFAVSLRKKKTKEIISAKRRRIMADYQKDQGENSNSLNTLEADLGLTQEQVKAKLVALCPEINDKKYSHVRIIRLKKCR